MNTTPLRKTIKTIIYSLTIIALIPTTLLAQDLAAVNALLEADGSEKMSRIEKFDKISSLRNALKTEEGDYTLWIQAMTSHWLHAVAALKRENKPISDEWMRRFERIVEPKIDVDSTLSERDPRNQARG